MDATSSEKTVGEWVVERPSRARIFERVGIDYCCGGKLPLRRACEQKSLSYDAILAELGQDQPESEQAERNWASASLTDLCDHIEQTHHAFLKQELPRLEFLTAKVAARHGDTRPALQEVHAVLMSLKTELESHMGKEERVLFPLCRELDSAEKLPDIHCGTIGNPIEVMTREHEDAGDALARIRTLTDDFACPADACNTYRAMYDSLHHLEQDMHRHVHLENNILFPKAIRLEKLLRAQA